MTATIFQITMRSGPVPGKTFVIENEETTLGRDLANDISISDPEVSRRHARFLMRDDNVFVEDLGSTNGTFLNGERIASPQQLRKGDVITFGESVVVIYDKQTVDADATVAAPPVVAGYPEPTPTPAYLQEVYQAPQEPAYKQPEPYEAIPAEMIPEPVERKKKRKKVRGEGLPTWMIILIVAIVVIVCVIAVTMWFMPASWWCAITFDMLAGCPLP